MKTLARMPGNNELEDLEQNVQVKKILSKNAKDYFWQGRRDSNSRHPVLETGALPTELRP